MEVDLIWAVLVGFGKWVEELLEAKGLMRMVL